MNILLVGFGSIGQRHYRTLLKLGFSDCSVYDPDDKKFAAYKGKRLSRLTPEDFRDFNVVFVCNPTHLHAQTALWAAKAGCHMFIEKPLSHTLKGLRQLVDLAQKKRLITFMACNLRFYPAVQEIKGLLEQKFLGKVHAMYFEYGRYLPYQRPGIDYREVYAAHKEMGGGILLDDIHAFDVLFWLNGFEKVRTSSIHTAKVSNLDIDTEDISHSYFEFENRVIGVVQSDYLQQYKHRRIKIIGEKGNLEWNFRDNTVFFETNERGKEKVEKLFSGNSNDRESAYVQEVAYFLSCVQKKRQTHNDVGKAYKILLELKR